MVERHKAVGRDTKAAQELLAVLERTQKVFERALAELEKSGGEKEMSAYDPKRTWNLGAVSRADLLDAAQNEVTKKVGAAVPVWRQPLRPPARG